jgi:hypothetical protein
MYGDLAFGSSVAEYTISRKCQYDTGSYHIPNTSIKVDIERCKTEITHSPKTLPHPTHDLEVIC